MECPLNISPESAAENDEDNDIRAVDKFLPLIVEFVKLIFKQIKFKKIKYKYLRCLKMKQKQTHVCEYAYRI